ncbi:MAG: nodulation protein NfeD [Rhodanobacteraceae bacterium]
MSKHSFALWLFAALATMLVFPAADAQRKQPAQATPQVLRLTLDGPVSPASASYIERGIRRAADQHMQAVLLEMDTPGGLDTSMRSIIKAILASPVPVIGYVAPSGSRAASAGTYVLYACHVAAMAPATNLGAATPIQLLNPGKPDEMPNPASASSAMPKVGSAETRKAVNDAVAYIRSLAEQRGRNADWAEQAVRNAVSLGARQALAQHVIDLVEPDADALLAAVDGRKVSLASGSMRLHTAGAHLNHWMPDWRIRFLGVIANPSIAYLLLLIGIFGLLLEGYNPGAVLPGVVGAICLLLALYAFQLLPVNFAGLLLMALGVVLIIAEAFVPAYGSLGIGGIISFVIGSVVLMDTGVPGFGLPMSLIVTVALVAALLVVGIVWMAWRSQRRPQVSGAEELVGMVGEAVEDFAGKGTVHVHGERWQARSAVPLRTGDTVRVTAIHGLVLEVAPVSQPDSQDPIQGES